MLKIVSLMFLVFSFIVPLHAANDAPGKKKYTVAFAQDTLANDWRLAQVNQLKAAFKKYPNIQFIHTDGEGDTTKQIQDIENLMHMDIDLLITSPRNGVAMNGIISKAYKKIPVVLITRSISSNNFTTLVSPDDYQIASEAAHLTAKSVNGFGKILMLRGVPTASTAIKREKGFIETIKKHYPKIKIVAIKNGNYLRSDSILAVDEVLSEGIQFDAIYAHSDSMASGARVALKHAGIEIKSKKIIGIDYISEARRAIINNEQYASFLYPTCAEEAAEAVMNILNNKKVRKKITVRSIAITKENVKQVNPIF